MKILLATDCSDFSKAAVEACRNIIADPKSASVKIISAVERPMPIAAEPFAISAEYYNEIEKAGSEQAKGCVEQAEREVRSMFPDVSLNLTAEVIDGSPQQVIVGEAENWGADLIVIGSHGYGFWSRVLLGSVSNAVVHHAPCLVLVVKNKLLQM